MAAGRQQICQRPPGGAGPDQGRPATLLGIHHHPGAGRGGPNPGRRGHPPGRHGPLAAGPGAEKTPGGPGGASEPVGRASPPAACDRGRKTGDGSSFCSGPRSPVLRQKSGPRTIYRKVCSPCPRHSGKDPKRPACRPGSLIYTGDKVEGKTRITIVDYDEQQVQTREITSWAECPVVAR